MNPREFCSQPGYENTIFLTYSFDPIFFERVVWRALKIGGTRKVVVVGDRTRLVESVARSREALQHLGREYLLIPAQTNGLFHPKLILRTGQKGAAVWIGSGNLTYSGWAVNYELASSGIMHTRDDFVLEIVCWVNSFCNHPLVKKVLPSIKPSQPAPASTTSQQSLLLSSEKKGSLAIQLARRWKNRKFKSLKILTGFTDETAAFVEWCYYKFGISDCVIYVDPSHASLKPEKLNDLPLKLLVVPVKYPPLQHAKLYWFSGKEGNGAVMGSPNCSRMAWLVPPEKGGNIEAALVYDKPETKDFDILFSKFAKATKMASEIDGWGMAVSQNERKASWPFYIENVDLYNSLGKVEVKTSTVLPSNSNLVMSLGNSEIPLERSAEFSDIFEGILPNDWQNERVNLVRVKLQVDNERPQFSNWQWMNSIDELEKNSRIQKNFMVFDGLRNIQSSSELNQIVDDLILISTTIFNNAKEYADPIYSVQHRSLNKNLQNISSVDPDHLIKSLREFTKNELPHSVASSTQDFLSIEGVIKALFNVQDRSSALEQELDSDSDVKSDVLSVEILPDNSRTNNLRTLNDGLSLKPKMLNRLIKKMEDYFDQFSKLEFLSKCSVNQFKEALSYPIAVSVLGKKHNWLEDEVCLKWMIKLSDLLFLVEFDDDTQGIIKLLRRKFADKGKTMLFQSTIGSGTLWVVLLTHLNHIKWSSPFNMIDKAIAVREIFYNLDLRSSIETGKLNRLINSFLDINARKAILQQAPVLARTLDEIEGFLESHGEEIHQLQLHEEHNVGDYVWSSNLGWGKVLEKAFIEENTNVKLFLHSRRKKTQVKSHRYLYNLEIVKRKKANLRQIVEKLKQT